MTPIIFKVTLFSLLTIQSSVNSIYNSYRHKRSREIRNILAPIPKLFESNNNKSHNSDSFHSTIKFRLPTEATLKENINKKWQVGRVSRKQYEIINMLWRKTKIFIDVNSTTATNTITKNNLSKRNGFNITKRNPFSSPLMLPKLQTTTASYIEFYYLEDNNNESFKDQQKIVNHFKESRDQRKSTPLFAFHFIDPKLKTMTTTIPYTNTIMFEKPSIYNLPFVHINRLKKKVSLNDNTKKTHKSKEKQIRNQHSDVFVTCPHTTQMLSINNKTSISQIKENTLTIVPHKLLTTVYDKIKFFEIYDRNTRNNENAKTVYDYNEINQIDNVKEENNLNSNKTIFLEHVNKGIGHHNGSHVNKFNKRHNRENIIQYKTNNPTCNIEYTTSRNFETLSKLTRFNTTLKWRKTELSKLSTLLQNNGYKLYNKSEIAKSHANVFYNLSRRALWSDYPFAAVYVYEPSQIHCDAAAISSHWLVAAASCLSGHYHKNPATATRSAFVTYCGSNWRQPERIAYVKYSLVHPRYSPFDEQRRYNYNIGIIKVINAMSSSCPQWSPLALISHQYTTKQESIMAFAVGWGLDRYDTRNTITALPKWPLMIFTGLIYSDSCPGNNAYYKAKKQNDERVKNLYCLSLPPYLGEEHDPVHGSILIVGGKLIALYLQEERRPWGEQSAIYTGIWRLIPWILDVARELDDTDVFMGDI